MKISAQQEERVRHSAVPPTLTSPSTREPEAVIASVQIGGEELVRRLAGRWEKLCEETRSAPFHRPEWIAAYLRAFEPRSEVVLLTASVGERLVAVLPMIRKRCWFAGMPIWKLTGAANIHSVRFDILRTACEAGETAVQVLWDLLKNMGSWHILEMPLIPEKGSCEELITHANKDGYRTITAHFHDGPILRMKEDEKGQLDWLHSTSRHFRHELRRFARLLAEETGDSPKLVRRTDVDSKILEEFYALEASGWKGEEGSAINCDPETRTFYDQIAQEASTRGYFCLHSLETNAGMVAGAFSVETEQCFYPMKIAYDEGLRRGGPGQLLFNGIFAECAEKRVPELFFGGKNDRYKTSWTSDTLPHFNGFIFSRALRARLVYEAKTNVFPRLGRLRRGILGQFKPGKKSSDSRPKVKASDEGAAKRPHETETAE
jgi:CelD/BcsL family acetyltransferase involved in cellulose biosynthesis